MRILRAWQVWALGPRNKIKMNPRARDNVYIGSDRNKRITTEAGNIVCVFMHSCMNHAV